MINGILKLGYYKNVSGNEHQFEGEISKVDKISHKSTVHKKDIQDFISHVCPGNKGDWRNKKWTELLLAIDSAPTCSARGKKFLSQRQHARVSWRFALVFPVFQSFS